MELTQAIEKIVAMQPYKIVLSAPAKGNGGYRRATLVPVANGWQLERLSDTQAFHENIKAAALPAALEALLTEAFTQANAFGPAGGLALRVSKKGRVLLSKTAAAGGGKQAPAAYPSQAGPASVSPAAPGGPASPAASASGGAAAPAPAAHNRVKNSILAQGTVIPPLVDMGVFTADGRVKNGMYDKYRQINRFVELVDDAFKGKAPQRLSVIDFGCGKSYLTFILYHYLANIRGIQVDMVGLDLKQKVVENCNAAARRYGYTGLRFEVGDIARWQRSEPVDMVVTLHACDTATDYALANAVGWGARHIFSVPCCQHELNAQMQPGGLGILTRYGLVQERVAALMTDAVRASLLTAAGYKTQLVEFVELEHTPKNILVRAAKTGVPAQKRREAMAEVEALCSEFSLSPTLLTLLQQRGLLAPGAARPAPAE